MLHDLHAWPELLPCVVNWTPEEVRKLKQEEERSSLLDTTSSNAAELSDASRLSMMEPFGNLQSIGVINILPCEKPSFG